MIKLSDGIKTWLTVASDEILELKLEEYEVESRTLSPRDTETRATLASAIRAELLRRAAS